MIVTMRGTRGSIPVPGPDTVKYGGNTTCIEVVTDAGDRIIIDGGTGIRQLGLDILAQQPLNCSIFITHTHWDHIQGFPFFIPMYIPGNRINIYRAKDAIFHKDLESILAQQMEFCYFPIPASSLKEQVEYRDIDESETVVIGSATVTPIILNHPVRNFGYRIDADGKSLFFTGDYEPPYNYEDPDDPDYDIYQGDIDQRKDQIHRFIKGCDLLICDAMYTEEEYLQKREWGHGTPSSAIAMATACGASQLLLTHHEPVRTDAQFDLEAEKLAQRDDIPANLQVAFAREGISIHL